jgi:HD-like signal output (HDOD) protein
LQEGEDLMPTAKQLLARFNDSKTLPHVALRLVKLLSDEGSRIQEFEGLIKMDPELFARTWKIVASESRSLPEVEREIIGTDHCELGALLAQEWNLTEEITSGILKHHAAEEVERPNSMTGIVQIAEFIALKMDYGAMPNLQVTLCTALAGHVKDHLQEYRLLADFPPGWQKRGIFMSNKMVEGYGLSI